MSVKTDKVELGEGGIYPDPTEVGIRPNSGRLEFKDDTHDWEDLGALLDLAATPMTTLGDTEYHNGTGITRLAGNTSATKKFLQQTGNGTISAAPTWDVIAAGDLPTGIDAAKIADGSVSNAEFQRLDGVTSAIQTQLDAKVTLSTAQTVSGSKSFTAQNRFGSVTTDTVPYSGFASQTTNTLEIGSGSATSMAAANFASLILSNNNSNTSGLIGYIYFCNNNIGGSDKRVAQFGISLDGATNSGYLFLATANAGTLTEAFRVDSSQRTGFGLTPASGSGRVQIANSFTTTTDVVGVSVSVTSNNSTGTRTNAIGAWIKPVTHTDAGTVTNAYGILVDAITKSAGTITTAFGMYINAPTGGSANFAAWFNGLTVVTSTVDARKLLVKGHTTQTNNLMEFLNSSDTQLAYVKGDGGACFPTIQCLDTNGFKTQSNQNGGTASFTVNGGGTGTIQLDFEDGLFISANEV